MAFAASTHRHNEVAAAVHDGFAAIVACDCTAVGASASAAAPRVVVVLGVFKNRNWALMLWDYWIT